MEVGEGNPVYRLQPVPIGQRWDGNNWGWVKARYERVVQNSLGFGTSYDLGIRGPNLLQLEIKFTKIPIFSILREQSYKLVVEISRCFMFFCNLYIGMAYKTCII